MSLTSSSSVSPHILLVHPVREQAERCQAILMAKGWGFHTVASAAEALQYLSEQSNTKSLVILIHADVPDVVGHQLCRVLKHSPIWQNSPVLLLAPLPMGKLDRFLSFKAGADDVLDEREFHEQLIPKINLFFELYQKRPERSSPHPVMPLADQVDALSLLTGILDKALSESTLINEFRGLSDMVHDRWLMAHLLFGLLETILDYDLAMLILNEHGSVCPIAIHTPYGVTVSQAQCEVAKAQVLATLAQQKQVFIAEEDILLEWIGAVPTATQADTPSELLYFHPIVFSDNKEWRGILGFWSAQKTFDAQAFLLSIIESECRLLVQLRDLYARAEMLAIKDSLTNLYNRRQLMMTLERDLKIARRYGHHFSFALIDVDYFKLINDEYGHVAGDFMLKHIADIAYECFRRVDFVARYGGEEFAVILPDTTTENAYIACERFRKAVEASPLVFEGKSLQARVSIGLIDVNEAGTAVNDLIKLADSRLYRCKQQGRNQIIWHEPTE